MQTSRRVLLLGAGLLAVLAGWWLLRAPTDALSDTAAVLRRSSTGETPDGDAIGFTATTETRSDQPTPLAAVPPAPRAASGRDVAAGADALRLTIVHADGAPASGATAVLVEAGTPRATGLTDATGRVSLLPSAADATHAASAASVASGWSVIVGGASDIPQRVLLPGARGEQPIALPPGLHVEGRVLLDGAPLREPLLLGLRARPAPREPDFIDDAIHDVSYEALRASVPGQALGREYNAQVVAPDGHFDFSSLPEAWSGEFTLHRSFEIVGGKESLKVKAPATGVVLRLRSAFTVRGRVLDVDGAAPVPGALVSFTGVRPESQHAPDFKGDVVCDAGGRFAIPIGGGIGALDSLSLRIMHPEGSGWLRHGVDATALDPDPDLGDLVLLPARTPLHLEVHDADGAPVRGAVAKSDDSFAARSPPSDDFGRTVLRGVPLDTTTFAVWAHRYFGLSVPLPDPAVVTDEAHPLIVVLERCPSLDVIVSRADGAVPAGLRVVIESADEIFASSDTTNLPPEHRSFLPDPMVYEVGMSAFSASEFKTGLVDGVATASGTVGFAVGADGRVSLSNLLAEVPFRLSVQDEANSPVWGPLELSVQPGEARVVKAVIAQGAADLSVHVTDVAGAPLARAWIDVLIAGKGGNTQQSTRADGTALLKNIYADTVALVVEKEGYVTQRLEDVAVMRGAPLEIVLQLGRCVRVFVHDTQGRPVPAETVRALVGGMPVGGARLEHGSQGGVVQTVSRKGVSLAAPDAVTTTSPGPDRSRWLLTDLPQGELELEAHVGGRTFTATCPRGTEADIQVPDVGTLFVHTGFSLDRTRAYRLDVNPSGGGDDGRQSRWLTATERANGEVNLPALVPDHYDITLSSSNGAGFEPAASPMTAQVTADATVVVQLDEP